MYEFDIGVVIKATSKKILEFAILLILYINSILLYDCQVTLCITQEKQLMVDMINIHLLYK